MRWFSKIGENLNIPDILLCFVMIVVICAFMWWLES